MNPFELKNSTLLIALLASIQMAHASTFVWTNTVGGNWSNPNNWSPNGVPGQLNALSSADDVLITNAGTYTVVLDEGTAPAFWDVRSMTLGGGSGTQTLVMTNKILYVAPLVITNSGVLNDVGSSFHATIAVQNGGKLLSTGGTYFANPFTIGSGAAFTTRGGTIIESGSLEVDGTLAVTNGTLTLDSSATNTGTITIAAGAGLAIDNAFALLAPLTNSGMMTIENAGAVSISNNLSSTRGGMVNLSGGTLNFNNTNGLSGGNNHEFFINQGTINSGSGGAIQGVPGCTNFGAIYVTANTLNFNSGLQLEPAGSLNVQLNSASSYGRIAISGTAALAGAFNVSLGGGYNPQNGDSFQPVTYGAFSGNFSSTNLPSLVPWQMSYGATAVALSVTTRSIVWTNTLGGNWSDPNNWSPNIVPGSTTYGNDDDVLITNAGTYTVVFDEGNVTTAYYLHSLAIGGSGNGFQTLAVSNTWPDVGSMSVNLGGYINSSGNHWFNNWVAPLAINDRGFFNSTNDLFDQNVAVNNGGNLTAVNSTNGNGALTINNNGLLKIPSSTFVLNGAATNLGTITISNGATLVVNDTLALVNSGYLWNQSGGTILIASGHGISGDNGAEILSNQGQINSSGGYIQSVPNFNDYGIINVTTSTFNLDSGLHLESSGSLNVQLNSATNYGKIAINGNPALTGAFGVTLNYSPANGDSFTPLTYSSYSGNFNNLNLPPLGTGQSWQSSLTATALTLQVSGTVAWTNTAGGNWSVAANWNPNKVPGQFDDVTITMPGTYTLVMDTGAVNVRSLALGAGSGTQTLAMSGKTLYVNPLTINSGGVLDDNGSTFHAAITVASGGQIISTNGTYYVAPLAIENGGQMTAGGGGSFVTFHGSLSVENGGVFTPVAPFGVQIGNDASLTVQTGGLVNIPTGRIFLYGPMTNSGTIDLTGGQSSTDIRIDNNGTSNDRGFLLNLPGGTINFNGNGGSIGADYTNDVFINQGAVVNVGGSQHSITVSDFDSTGGTVTNLAGTFIVKTFSNTLAGVYYSAPGTTIQLTGGTASNPLKPGVPLMMTGGGNIQFYSGWLDLTNDTIANLQLIGGTLELEPTFQGGAITNLILDGILLTNAPGVTWPVTNGTFAVTNSTVYGNLIVENGGHLVAWFNNPFPTFYGGIHVENGSSIAANGAYFYGNVSVDSGGEFDNLDAGSTLQPGSSFTINSGGTFNSGYYLYDYAPMTNFGTLNITNFGYPNDGYNIRIQNDGSRYFGGLVNEPGGRINFLPGAGATPGIYRGGSYDQGYFINQGTLVSSVSAGVDIPDLENSGTITNLSGTLMLGVFRNTLAGHFYTAGGATTQFYGGTAAAPLTPGALTASGSGLFQFISYDGYGWLDLPTDIIPNLDLRSGVLELEPGFQGGVITNLTLDGIIFTNQNALPIAGTINTTNSVLAGTFIVTNSGVWNAYADNIYGPIVIQSGGVLNDVNTIQTHPPGSLTIAQNGQMNLNGGYLYVYTPVTNSGVINLPNNNQIYIYNNGAADQGGLVNQPGGAVTFLSSGGISGNEGGDYIVNNGTLLKTNSSGTTYINVSHFTNSSAITSLEGTLNLNKITLQPSGSLNVRLNSKTDYGSLALSGSAALTGSLGVTLNGTYVPNTGDSFTPLTYGSYTGNFTATNLPSLVAWQTTYNPTALTLVVMQTGLMPEFTTVTSSGGNLILNGTNGVPGHAYWVLSSTNLALPLPQWSSVATNNFDANGGFRFTNSIDTGKPEKFFILQPQ